MVRAMECFKVGVRVGAGGRVSGGAGGGRKLKLLGGKIRRPRWLQSSRLSRAGRTGRVERRLMLLRAGVVAVRGWVGGVGVGEGGGDQMLLGRVWMGLFGRGWSGVGGQSARPFCLKGWLCGDETGLRVGGNQMLLGWVWIGQFGRVVGWRRPICPALGWWV